jgi:hypothetical protein
MNVSNKLEFLSVASRSSLLYCNSPREEIHDVDKHSSLLQKSHGEAKKYFIRLVPGHRLLLPFLAQTWNISISHYFDENVPTILH